MKMELVYDGELISMCRGLLMKRWKMDYNIKIKQKQKEKNEKNEKTGQKSGENGTNIKKPKSKQIWGVIMGADRLCLRVRFRWLGGVGYQSVVGCQLVLVSIVCHIPLFHLPRAMGLTCSTSEWLIRWLVWYLTTPWLLQIKNARKKKRWRMKWIEWRMKWVA